jgi:hypothetical protein
MTPSNLLDRLRQVHGEAEMQGWDFSILDGRLKSNNPPWDFEAPTASHTALTNNAPTPRNLLRSSCDLTPREPPQLCRINVEITFLVGCPQRSGRQASS